MRTGTGYHEQCKCPVVDGVCKPEGRKRCQCRDRGQFCGDLCSCFNSPCDINCDWPLRDLTSDEIDRHWDGVWKTQKNFPGMKNIIDLMRKILKKQRWQYDEATKFIPVQFNEFISGWSAAPWEPEYSNISMIFFPLLFAWFKKEEKNLEGITPRSSSHCPHPLNLPKRERSVQYGESFASGYRLLAYIYPKPNLHEIKYINRSLLTHAPH